MRSLIKKGVAMPIAVTFMLASPIVNPISIISTLYAFPQQPSVALLRLYFGLTIAFGIGLLLLFYPEEKYLKEEKEDFDAEPATQPYTLAGADTTLRLATGRAAPQNVYSGSQPDFFNNAAAGGRVRWVQAKLYTLLMHTCSEFFTAGPFLILGAFITALIRAAVPQEFFSITGGSAAVSLILMMLFAFVFSACSTSDAFIARSFLNRFSLGSILGFLVYGPMMDIKNLFMLFSLFKKRFVIELTIIITVVNFIGISVLSNIPLDFLF